MVQVEIDDTIGLIHPKEITEVYNWDAFKRFALEQGDSVPARYHAKLWSEARRYTALELEEIVAIAEFDRPQAALETTSLGQYRQVKDSQRTSSFKVSSSLFSYLCVDQTNGETCAFIPIYPHFASQKRSLDSLFCSIRRTQNTRYCCNTMFSLPLSSSNVVSSVSSLESSRKHHQTRSPRGIVTKAADVTREGNDLLRRQRRRGEEEHEEEQTKTKSRV
jgi:hypothetical protein